MLHKIEVRPAVCFQMFLPDGTDPTLEEYRAGRCPHSIRHLLHALQLTAAPGAKVLDLGGYVGGFGLAAAALDYEVVVVEANPISAAMIRESAAANSFFTVQVIQAAVGAEHGSVSFVANGPWGHVSSDVSDDRATDTVTQLTLPAVLKIAGWDTPAFIKMDVEGSEANVLVGAKDWFAAGHRPVILYEANGHTLNWFHHSPRTLNGLIDGLGYHRYEVDNDGQLRVPAAFEPQCLVDYLAAPRALTAAPPLDYWRLFKRTVRALRSPSPHARHYTRELLAHTMLGR